MYREVEAFARDAEPMKRDAPSYDTRADANNRFGEVPAKRKIL